MLSPGNPAVMRDITSLLSMWIVTGGVDSSRPPPDSQHVQDDEDGDGSAVLGSQGCEEVGCACNIAMSAKPVFFS